MPVGQRVVVIGGGLVGLELAEFMVERGRNVTVLEEGDRFGLEMAHPRRWRVLDDLRTHGVELVARALVESNRPDEVTYTRRERDAEQTTATVAADTVILAVGLAPNPGVARSHGDLPVPVREIGDVTGVGYLEGAIRDGFDAAMAL